MSMCGLECTELSRDPLKSLHYEYELKIDTDPVKYRIMKERI